MTQKNTNWLGIASVVLLLIVGGMILANKPVAPPTAADIAAEIVIPTPTTPELDFTDFDLLLEGIYPGEVRELQSDCIRQLRNEHEGDLYQDLEHLFAEDVTIHSVNKNWDNKYDFTVTDLGLDREEDRAATISSILRVKYTTEFGESDAKFAKVDSSAVCASWDDEDNEFDTLTVNYILA